MNAHTNSKHVASCVHVYEIAQTDGHLPTATRPICQHADFRGEDYISHHCCYSAITSIVTGPELHSFIMPTLVDYPQTTPISSPALQPSIIEHTHYHAAQASLHLYNSAPKLSICAFATTSSISRIRSPFLSTGTRASGFMTSATPCPTHGSLSRTRAAGYGAGLAVPRIRCLSE